MNTFCKNFFIVAITTLALLGTLAVFQATNAMIYPYDNINPGIVINIENNAIYKVNKLPNSNFEIILESNKNFRWSLDTSEKDLFNYYERYSSVDGDKRMTCYLLVPNMEKITQAIGTGRDVFETLTFKDKNIYDTNFVSRTITCRIFCSIGEEILLK